VNRLSPYITLVAAGLGLTLVQGSLRAQSCRPYWAAPAMTLGAQSTGGSFFTFDDGSGPALYVGGIFGFWSGLPYAHTVARWNGQSWAILSDGLPQGPSEYGPWIRVFDDGLGPQLYALGSYSTYPVPGRVYWISKWNGTAWVPANGYLYGLTLGVVPRLSVDLGNGPKIYGIRYLSTGTILVQWTGTGWVDQGAPANGQINDLIVHNDGAGPALYAAGGFSAIGSLPARRIAKWDGQQWSALGTGLGLSSEQMAVYDDGRGPALYVVGGGWEAGGVPVNHIARWDGQRWEDVGGGLTANPGSPEIVYAAGVFDDGSGLELYVSGRFSYAGGVPARGIAKWNGTRWAALGAGLTSNYVHSFTVFNDGRGPALFVAETSGVGGGGSPGVAQWVGCPSCYADCDNNQKLNVNDFICFINMYAQRNPYANCTVDAVMDVADFMCFMTKFGQGCL